MDSDAAVMPSLSSLAVALLAIVLVALCLLGLLYSMRRKRQAQKQTLLPVHHRCSSHHRLTISATSFSGGPESVYVIDETRDLPDHGLYSSQHPVPEIRITFPDEETGSDKPTGGRVVVLRIGDSGAVGMEPVSNDPLPPYQSSDADRFHSLDLDRMGGLKEKEEARRWS